MVDMAAENAPGEIEAGSRYDRADYIERLFDENYNSLHRLAFALIGEATAAEEIAQEAFVRLYASWHRLDRIEHPSSFLRQIVLNLCRSRGRRIAVSKRLDPLLRSPSSVHQPDVALRMDVWAAIQSLPTRQRACAVLRYLEDLSEPEIGELLGCSKGTVKSQLHKARQKLEPLLRDVELEPGHD